MKSLNLIVLSLVAMLAVSNAFARGGFGGGRSGGFSGGRSSFSSGSSFRSSGSSFGGSRSSSSGVTISRPVTPSYTAPSIGHTTTVIHQGSSGGSGNGFMNGMIMGTLLNQHSGSTYVDQGQVQASNGTYMPAPIVIQQHGFFYYFFAVLSVFLFIGFIGLCAWAALESEY